MSLDFTKRRFPKGLSVIFIINGCFMFSLSLNFATLVLYLTNKINVPVKDAYLIFGAFISLFYSSAMLGGYLGGRIDHKLAIILGSVLAGLGDYLMVLPTLPSILLGLSCFIIGGGLMIPNINCLNGRMFNPDDNLRDSGFTITYIGSNIGGFIASLSAGFLANTIGYANNFAIGGTILWASLVFFLLSYKKIEFYEAPHIIPYKANLQARNWLSLLIAIFIFVPLVAWLLHHANLSNIILCTIGIIMFFTILFLAFKEKGLARKRLLGFLIFTTFSIAFWALYSLAPSVLNIFAENNVDRHLFGHFVFPAGSIYSLNNFFIIILGIITSLFFIRVSNRGRNIELPTKFGIGITLMGLGYLILIAAIWSHNSLGLVAFYWLVLSYFLQTAGELFVGPIGFAMVGSLVPRRLEGMMNGVWQLFIGISGAISSFLATATIQVPDSMIHNPLATNSTYMQLFGLYGAISVAIGIAILLLRRRFSSLWN